MFLIVKNYYCKAEINPWDRLRTNPGMHSVFETEWSDGQTHAPKFSSNKETKNRRATKPMRYRKKGHRRYWSLARYWAKKDWCGSVHHRIVSTFRSATLQKKKQDQHGTTYQNFLDPETHLKCHEESSLTLTWLEDLTLTLKVNWIELSYHIFWDNCLGN